MYDLPECQEILRPRAPLGDITNVLPLQDSNIFTRY